MPKISVIVPVYNVEKYLKRCLDSIINQTFEDIEIICVNDGSTDKSIEILEEYVQKDDRIIWLNQETQGLSAARNKGIENARGEFISFVDSDDFLDLDFYEKLYDAAKNNNADIAVAGILRENDKKSKVLVSYADTKVFENKREIFINAGLPKNCFVWNKIYSKNLFESGLRFVSGLIYEDMMFTPDILEMSQRVAVVSGTKYHYWKHSNTLIKGDCDKYRADKLLGSQHLRKFCNKYGINSKNELVSKKEFFIFGMKIMKVYNYRATSKYYLFGLIPVMTVKTNV